MAPEATLLYDPLRVLRVARFAAKFDATLDEKLVAALRLARLKEAFVRQTKRDRVGLEVCGCPFFLISSGTSWV